MVATNPVGFIVRVGDHFTERATEWFVSCILLTWGLVCVSSPAELWEMPIYAPLASIASQAVWGTSALIIAVGRLIALYINGSRRRSPHLRAAGAFFACFIWMQLSLGLFVSPLAPLMIAFCPWLFVIDFYNVWRAARDARLSDMKAEICRGAMPDATSA